MNPESPSSAIVAGLDAVGIDGTLHLAIGMFDGVHLGHQAVIESAIHAARGDDGISGVLTFHPHPSRVIAPGRATELIQPRQVKNNVLQRLGVELIVWQEFTESFAGIAARAFLGLVKERIPSLSTVHVGENFRFGKGREGDIETLISEGKRLGLAVLSVERIRLNGEPISSSRIRECLETGRLQEANALFGYPYFSIGRVVEGRRLGRTLGFPTVNIPWVPECTPAYGVYCVRAVLPGGKRIAGVANYGVRPTVSEESEPLLEIHFLDAVEEIAPGTPMTVEWLYFLRREKRFASIAELKAQIARDIEQARERAVTR